MKFYNVGIIVGFHGLKGEMKIKSTTDFEEERFGVGSQLILRQGKKESVVTIRSRRVHKNVNLIAFVGYDTLNDVEQFKGSELKIDESQLLDLEEDEFYNFELIGMEVYDFENNLLGTIKKVLDMNANDVFVINGKEKEIMVPFVSSIVNEVSIEDNKITLFEIEGLW
ncbi:MAG: ribosome maturation factor RimM [Erysipelotrichales bacterium]